MQTENLTSHARDIRPARLGWWTADGFPPKSGDTVLSSAVKRVAVPMYVVDLDGRMGVGRGGVAAIGPEVARPAGAIPLVAYAPALPPERLGDPGFLEAHSARYAYVAGAMANGISSEELVEAVAQAGMMGFFGAAGLELERVARAIDRLQGSLGDLPYGFNLIHSPHDPTWEAGLVDLYLRRRVRLVSASAYLDLTLPLIRYRVSGIGRDADGNVLPANKVVAKVSRLEVARKFFAPPPEEMLRALVKEGSITQEQAQLARLVPVAEDLTAEADSGGHTDNRPALGLLPTMLALRDQMQKEHGYSCRLRVGAAGGIATPASAAAAFAMGAAYILTGSVNQACVEAGTSATVREMLARAGPADVIMAPAADMFEMGVKVQVLKWGTLFAVRARKLYELYRAYDSVDELPAVQQKILERDFFRSSLGEVWAQTREYFAGRDPVQVTRAEKDPKHRMALLFRAYLGQASRWAHTGEPDRRADYQIWCGPAMGAFNEWVRGSFLESPARREAAAVAMNLLVGAAALTRAGWLRVQGVPLSPDAERFPPRTLEELTVLSDTGP